MALVPFPNNSQKGRLVPGDDPDADQELVVDEDSGRMSFLEHLDELRKRIVHAMLGVCVGVLISFFFIDRIFNFIFAPIREILPKGSKLIYTEPGEAFYLYVQIALIAGAMIAAPYIMLQVWLFIAPGLYQHEKRFAWPFIFLTTVGFLGGALFNHYVVFKWMMVFFAGFTTTDLTFMPRLDPVFALYTKMLLGMGLVFQMPAVVFFMARMGIVTARLLIRNFKYAVLGIFVTAAVITPSGDAGTQVLFATPMLGLYFISIGIAWLFGKKRIAKEDN